MTLDVLIEDILIGIFGNLNYAAVLIIAFFIIAFIFIGLNVRFSVLATTPLGVTFSDVGWLNSWVAGAYWIFIIGFGLYTIWALIMQEY